MAGRLVRFLGTGRRVEVAEKSRERAITVTFKGALGRNSMPARFPKNDPAAARSHVGPGRKCLDIRRKLLANPSQANCDWNISLPHRRECSLVLDIIS